MTPSSAFGGQAKTDRERAEGLISAGFGAEQGEKSRGLHEHNQGQAGMPWSVSYRADPITRAIADQHYNRQKIGSPQFVPPGRCIVLRSTSPEAAFVTSWPFAEFVKHAWAGAWVNSLFRSHGGARASDLILSAIAATRFFWSPPPLGIVSFVDPGKVPGVMVRGERVYGFCYLMAGFKRVEDTKGGLWAWQLLPAAMPAAIAPSGAQMSLLERNVA